MRILGLTDTSRWQQSKVSSGWILALLAISGLGAIAVVLLSAYWAGQESDAAALDRQRRLVDTRLREQVEQFEFLVGRVAERYFFERQPLPNSAQTKQRYVHNSSLDPASATALAKVTIDAFGIDQAFVVDDSAHLFMLPEPTLERHYKWMRPLFMPQLKEQFEGASSKREKVSPPIAQGSAEEKEQAQKTVTHLLRLEGRPAIVSTALIREGAFGVHADRHYLIAVKFLDGAALDRLSAEQGLIAARYARSADQDETEVAFQINATSGEPLGFIIWQPDLPGSRVVKRLVPALSGASIIIAVMFTFLLIRLRLSLQRLKDSEANSRRLALQDALTELPNRTMFSLEFQRRLSKLTASDAGFAVALLDLDRFKSVNDSFGHAVGDELIVAAAKRVSSLLVSGDMFARVGGDEFALLLDLNGRNDVTLTQLCNDIVHQLRQPFELCGGDAIASVGGSLGFSIIEGTEVNADDAMKRADLALYKAKSQGRDQWQRYTISMEHERSARDQLKEDLRDVLASMMEAQLGLSSISGRSGMLEVYYQTVHSSTEAFLPSGAEALVRWHHPTKGTLSPPAFIPVAEEAGMIGELGRWVLRQACFAARDWPGACFVAVNVSPLQLRNPTFAQDVFSILRETGLSSHRLELELTESSLLEDNDVVHETLRALRASGIQVSLDDFGTGYSCLSHLIQFEVDRIKIDRSFVSKIGVLESGLSVVRTIVQLAHDLGKAITAEGVETEEQRDFLKAIGCTDLQGYLFAKPQPLHNVLWQSTGGSQPAKTAR